MSGRSADGRSRTWSGSRPAAWLRVRRRAVVGLVAADAVARRPLVDVVLVAGRARLRRVDADQREDAVVVEAAARATVGSVGRWHGLARRREAGRRVIGIRRALVVGQVAADAVARRALVDVVVVARRARLRGVDADQREDGGVVEAAAACHVASVGRWQVRTSVGKPAAAWFGFGVRL